MNDPATTASGDPIISLSGITKTFNGGAVRAVDDVSLDVERGDVYGVIGYSGAGKSTLVRVINALELPDSGRVVVDGRDVTAAGQGELREIRRDIGMIFQHFNLFNARTVAANIGYPLKLAKWPKKKRAERVAELLDFVGIADKAKRYPTQLSGGQKQRVGIARALATSPAVLLADEATSALDPETTREVLDLLRRINRELGVTIVLITHSMSVVQHLCNKVAVMEGGRIVERGAVYDVLARPEHPATRRFIASALADKPSEAVTDRLRRSHAGRLIVVSLRADGTDSFDLSALGVPASVVYGAITEVEERPFGSLTLELRGSADENRAAIERLREYADVRDLGDGDEAAPATGKAGN
ncbi:methionine ABC transporter ATP-binding protein [Rarobacter incanus]|uniref:D-methionine transport system ATP-binding protein n=1 Tax=Rarobacter incanus TaxID=153494 RepID=A0A542SNY5_9MICO|nr:ATP-binding cassette domain-containing protein [Rarobacter incanus]TQK76265.1 D-methionine transport system ATP-binding protein [Rarobacter incanus]